MVDVFLSGDALDADPFLKKVLMNVDEATARENALKLVARKLVVASAATDYDGFDV
jgi:hypothetical protein